MVLVAARNPLNIGAAARAMRNFGFSRLHVVNPYQVAFREARSAVGAASVLEEAQEFISVSEAVADCTLVVGTTAARGRETLQPLRRLEDGARLIRSRLGSGDVALLFGSEKRGLSNHDLSHCHFLMRIPTDEAHGSMNLGQAVAVCLYELIREAKPASRTEKIPSASAADLERITSLLFEALQASGYVQQTPEAAAKTRIRRLVRSLRIPAADVQSWLGFLRQILWKLGSSQE